MGDRDSPGKRKSGLPETRRWLAGLSMGMQKRCKPGYVGTVSMPCRSVIYLSRGVAAGLQQSTPGKGRAILVLPVYLTLQRIGCTPRNVSKPRGGLLPRLFTLTHCLTGLLGGRFLLHCPCRRRQLSVRKYAALCCPDFPLAATWRQATDRASA